MLDFESCQSLEKLVLDDEVCGMALHLVRGISHDSAAEAVGLIQQVVQLGGFLGHRHTREHFRRELHLAGPVIDRETFEAWQAGGGRDALDRARDQVRQIVARGNPAPVSAELRRELDGLIGAEARRLGIDSLPNTE
jgi:trimethylamine--corrinoid protein Co-methyltransferase